MFRSYQRKQNKKASNLRPKLLGKKACPTQPTIWTSPFWHYHWTSSQTYPIVPLLSWPKPFLAIFSCRWRSQFCCSWTDEAINNISRAEWMSKFTETSQENENSPNFSFVDLPRRHLVMPYECWWPESRSPPMLLSQAMFFKIQILKPTLRPISRRQGTRLNLAIKTRNKVKLIT